MRNFQISIVSAVKICRQCLQTASANSGLFSLFPDPVPGFRPWTLLGDFRSPDPLGYSPQIKIPVAPTGYGVHKVFWTHELTDSLTDGQTQIQKASDTERYR